jgi:glycosyltransferase involved in cell wall biosynthesis
MKFIMKFKNRIKLIKDVYFNIIHKKDVYYIIEKADWSIKHDGIKITTNLKYLTSGITTTHIGIKNSIVHYGSINMFIGSNKLRLDHKSNRIVVTWFHVVATDKRVIERGIIKEAIKYVDIWHTSNNLTKEELIKLGIPIPKIVVIPLGVDLSLFHPLLERKEKIRSKLKLPQDRVIIGSFQKDGVGWEDGYEPKLIKGPDIFCQVVEILSKKYEIFVLLTGPARGYVKRRLEKIKIPYFHHYLDSPDEIASFYNTLDLYLVTSRVEGGPKAILESLASGIPLVTTKVGMAPDVIMDGENGFIVEVDDVKEIVRKVSLILDNNELRKKIIKSGVETAKNFDWKCITDQYYELIYKRLNIKPHIFS